jgi:hypothetical protein
VPRHQFTEEERQKGNQYKKGGQKAVTDGRKGGINKGVNSPARKTMKELAEKISAAPIQSGKTKQQLQKLGFTDDEMINQAVVVAAVYMNAANGDMKAVEKWMELTEGLKPSEDGVQVIIDV